MGDKIKPLYDSHDYESYCKIQKQKGLKKCYWHELPGMYIEHLEWRKEFEEALEKCSND
jgi:hypothetical protein